MEREEKRRRRDGEEGLEDDKDTEKESGKRRRAWRSKREGDREGQSVTTREQEEKYVMKWR